MSICASFGFVLISAFPVPVSEDYEEDIRFACEQIERRDERTLDLAFTITVNKDFDPERAIVLSIDGFETIWSLYNLEQFADEISEVLAFPNPMSAETRFLVRTDLPPVAGRIQLFSVAGRLVATIPISPQHFSENNIVRSWEGRDEQKDELDLSFFKDFHGHPSR